MRLLVGVRGLETALARLLDRRMGRRWRSSHLTQRWVPSLALA
ncbi:hypothetical protein [Nocardioides sp. REDSEA-S30_B4]|jgi:hypothetical protein|nr:hypothetical protein [Nocardioides sp. REDSEA-S30_B4]